MEHQKYEEELSVKDMRLEVLSAEVERLNTYKDSLQEANESFMNDIASNLKQIAELEDKLNKEHSITEQLKIEFQDNEQRSNDELKKLRENYDEMIRENQNIYNEQVEMLREQVKVEAEEYEKYKK